MRACRLDELLPFSKKSFRRWGFARRFSRILTSNRYRAMDEITAEYSTDQIAPAAELRYRPRVTVACKTDLGRVRENNEDKFEYYLPEDEATLASRGQIFLVCDGMGGHAAGQIASELTAKT